MKTECDDLLITGVTVLDLRFPTSKKFSGSDAMHPDPDYSCAYVVLETDRQNICGYGLTFTLGRGNELCVAAAEFLAGFVTGKTLQSIVGDFGRFCHSMVNDGQYRWLGPEKGVVHLAAAAVINAVWDLWARVERKPLWLLVSEMTPEALVNCIDFSYITDELSPGQAIAMLKKHRQGYESRLEKLHQKGLPAYTTSPGWLGYSDQKLRLLCQQARDEKWSAVKLKVGGNREADVRRCTIAREVLGQDACLLLDANQKWGLDEALDWMEVLKPFRPYWIEEPTSPDDIIVHQKLSAALSPIKIATGEQCQNRVMFKQFLQTGAMDVCQIDSCRLAGVNEVLAVLLLAARHDIPVCPHAGGVGLCEYVQHLAIIDYLCIGIGMEGRMVEYVEHLHEHFVLPVEMKEGCYQVPGKPGYSAEIKSVSLARYQFPDGGYWSELSESCH